MSQDRKTISFYGTCDARGEKTLVSDRISYPFRTRQIEVHFAPGCENLMQVKFFLSDDANAPSSGEPQDMSLLAEHGHVGYVVGDGVPIVMNHTTEVPHAGAYIKVYANNTDYYAHDLNARVEIEPLEEGVV